MNTPAVFISYNPQSEVEQTLAIRLHTIGAVSGYNMMLPDRSFGSAQLSAETMNRINLSDYFIVFSTTKLSEVVRKEIEVAFRRHHDKSRILVVYDIGRGKNLAGMENCTEVMIDLRGQRADEMVNVIATKLKQAGTKGANSNDFMGVLGSILLVGVGLFALAELFDEEPKKPKRKSTARKKRSRLNA